MRWNNGLLRIEAAVFMSVVKYAAAVVVDEGFRQRPFSDDDVVRLKLDVEILNLVDMLCLKDGGAVYQILGFDQHAPPRETWRGAGRATDRALVPCRTRRRP